MTIRPVPSDESRRAYHSGMSGRLIAPEDAAPPSAARRLDRTVILETAKYVPPFDVTVRSNKTGWSTDHTGHFDGHNWRFTLPHATFPDSFDMKFMLDGKLWMAGNNVGVPAHELSRHFTDATVKFGYVVTFTTTHWQPSHLVTLRNNVDGWWCDVFGVYREGVGWQFFLDRDDYPDAFEAKLVLDQHLFMNGPQNLTITDADQFIDLDDSSVTFASTPYAFRHGYDNFTSLRTPLEQLTVGSVGREQDDYDVIVIGSGMGGGVLADDLADRGYRVLVLEAGGLRYPVQMNELPRSEIDRAERDEVGHFVNKGTPYFMPGVHFNLGGRSVYWSGLVVRMQGWEFRTKWPASVRQYLTQPNPQGETGYQRAELLMKKRQSLGPYQKAIRDHLNDPLQIGGEFEALDLPRSMHQPNLDAQDKLTNVLRRSTGCFSTADLLLDSLGFTAPTGRNNLKVNLHHLTTSLETSNGSVTEVVCQDLVGRTERRYRAAHVVLCCGSLESPRLAINSNLSDPNNLIGRGLTDHPAYFYQISHPLPDSGALGWIGARDGHAKLLIRHKSASATDHAYNIEVLINGRYWDTRHADDNLWDRVVSNLDPSRVEIKFIFDSLLVDANQITSNGVGRKLEVNVGVNQSAQGYKNEMVQARNKILYALGVTSALSTAWEDWEWSQGVHGTVHHAGGSLRMSDDGSGVVDEHLKFLGYDNLHCCDVSVFPTIPAANPSLTLVALAQRMAASLAARLGPPP